MPSIAFSVQLATDFTSSPAPYAGEPRRDGPGEMMLLASGRLENFVACYGVARRGGDGDISFDRATADILRLDVGDNVLVTAR